MTASRRDFLSALVATAVAPALASLATTNAAAQAGGPTRLPLQDFVKNAKLVESLRRGVQVMRSRPPSDPRSWIFQGAVHAINDRLLADILLSDPKVALVDQEKFWNRCPHSGQNSAEFTIWHRAYLYYFERILRDAAQDPDLALPFWDYNNPNAETIEPSTRLFPQRFANQFLDPPTNRQPNPLYHPNREQAFTSGRFLLSPLAVDIRDTMAQKSFFGATEAEGFAGGVADNDAGTQGFVERRPHNQIHFAVGGVIGEVAGAMADVPTAAFDPIFWVHHSNIDRLWVEWACSRDKDWGALPSRDWFEARPWFFHDFDLSVKNEQRLHYVQHRNLGIRYQGEDPSCVPLQLPPYIVGPVVAAAAARVRPFATTEALRVDAGVQASALQPATFVIGGNALARLDQTVRTTVQGASLRQGDQKILLEVQELTFDRPPSAGFDLYANLAPGETPSRQSAKFIGTLALFGLGQQKDTAHAHAHGGGQLFDISSIFASGGAPSELTIHVVPFDLLTPRGNTAPLRRPDAIRIKGFRIVTMSRL